MSTPRLVNGQDIGQAQIATRAVLDRLLAEAKTTFPQWVTLNAIATNGAQLERERLVLRLADGLKVEKHTAAKTIDELASLGLVEAPRHIASLTPAGEALHARLRSGIDAITKRLYGGLAEEDLAAAYRVLSIVTERANAELRDSPGHHKVPT